MIAVIFKQRIIIILFLCMEKHVAMAHPINQGD